MRFGDLLEFRKDIFFDGAVQIDWFYNKEKATLVAENFVFHGSEYHGATGGNDSNLKDTVSFVQEISEKINNEYPNNPLTLAIATYGTGKSHLGVTLAELFSGPDYNPKAYNAIISNIKEIDATKARAIEQNTQKKNLVLTINGMRDINLNAELLKVALKSLSLYGCSTENLKKINRALETASRFFERNAGNIDLFERHAELFGFFQKGDVLIENVIPKHLESIIAKLVEAGATVEEYDEAVRVTMTDRPKKCNIKTMPHPGFPTDMQPQIATLLAISDGTSIVTEGVWDNRFRYVDQLTRMGAQFQVDGKMAVITGVEKLSPAPVKAVDLRAGAAMIIAGLMTKGTTEVENIVYIDRGYENVAEKFQKLGADIKRVPIINKETALKNA